MPRVPTPIATESVAWQEFTDVPRFVSRWRHLTRAVWGPDYRIGVLVEELPPGGRSAPLHYHLREEEHVFVLDGRVTLRLGDGTHAMGPGDYVCFPAGQQAGHCLVNDGDAPCRYVVIGERKSDEVCVYPDSHKLRVRALGPAGSVDLAGRRRYWDGEETGLPAGVVPEETARVPPPADPKPPIASASVVWNDEGPGEGTRFGGRSRHLTSAAVGETYHVGVLIESPGPGRRLCPRHWHTAEEEHALVLEGEITLLLGEERHVMRPGDYVVFPAGQPLGHSFLNSGEGPASYLMIGGRDPNDVCVYPDSNKVGIAALPRGANILGMSNARRYWDGETLD